MKAKPTLPDLADLSPLELKRKISVQEAAFLNSMHVATFERNYPHLIMKISARRRAVALADAITLPPASPQESGPEAKRRGKRGVVSSGIAGK